MKKILAVDNHPVMLAFMKKLLQKEGYDVTTAKDGLSALAVLKDYIPDMMFIDLVMPNINGEKLCRIIRSMPEFDHTFIIIVSSIAVEKEPDLRGFGADACIAKGPFNKMTEHILNVLNSLKSDNKDELKGQIFGREYVFEREISKELISTNRHRELILDNMCEGILELSQRGEIIYANPASVSLVGILEEELLGSKFVALFEKEERKIVQTIMSGVVQNGIAEETSETSPIKLKNRLISLNILPVQDEDDKPLVVIINDLTERKKMETRLNQALKMEAIGTLSGGIAHDFNNLLQSIQGNISLLLLDVDAEHPHHNYLKKIENSIKNGAKLTEQLLGYARKGRYEVKTIDFNRLVQDSSEAFGRTKREISIDWELADDLHPIEADPGQIEQILWNLYVNAWQAMPEGGYLSLKTKNVSSQEIQSALYKPKPGNYTMLTVTDTGIGMDKETQARIFDPFFTTKEIGRGTGLGLASVYGIIKGHGGYIEVASTEGRGTTFSIYLPASSKKIDEDKSTLDNFSSEIETILFVDDEEKIVEANKRILKLLGFDVLTALGGKEALDIFKSNFEKIDVVILDMIMPDSGGAEVYNQMKEIDPNIKVLLSSGYSLDSQAKKIMDCGCNGFIQKPFEMKKLYQELRMILDKK